MDLPRGATLGDFVIDRRLGRGASGSVYLARSKEGDAGHPGVALKVLSPLLVDGDEVRERFRRAVAVAAELDHPGICKIYGVHEERGLIFLAMQPVDGQTLARLLDAREALTPDETLALLRGLAPPLDAAHAHGVIHRDLSPNNIMVGPHHEVTILEFGMMASSDVTRIAGLGRSIGSMRFIAPEVWQGQPASTRSDVYALGVVLATCLLGHTPDDVPTLDGTSVVRPPRLSPQNPSVRRTVEAVVRRCMAPDPRRRFASAGEVQRAFEEAIAADAAVDVACALARLHEAAFEDEELPARRWSLSLGKGTRARRWAAALACGVLGAGALALITAHRASRPSPAERDARRGSVQLSDHVDADDDGMCLLPAAAAHAPSGTAP